MKGVFIITVTGLQVSSTDLYSQTQTGFLSGGWGSIHPPLALACPPAAENFVLHVNQFKCL